MKLPFLYTLATMGVAAFTCLTILFLAGPPTAVAESNQKAPERRTTWMGALLEKAQSLAVPAGVSEEDFANELDSPAEFGENEYFISEEHKDFDYHGKPQFAKYESPTVWGGTATQNRGATQVPRKSYSEILLREHLGGSNGSATSGRSGLGGGTVIALSGHGNNSGQSSYREKLISTLLESLDDDEIAELVENQKKRSNDSKKP